MRYILLVYIVIQSLCTHAQIVRGGSNSPGFKMLEERPLLVVLTEDEEYNTALKSAFTNYWDYSKTIFIESGDIKKYDTRKEYNCYLSDAIEIEPVYKSQNKTLHQYYKVTTSGVILAFESISMIQSTNFAIIVPNNCGSPLLYKNPVYQIARLNYLIGGCNSTLQYIKKYNVKGVTTSSGDNILKEMSDVTAKKIRNKTLLVLEDMLQPAAEGTGAYISKEVLATYPYEYKIVSLDAFVKISNANDPDYCWLDMVVDQRKTFFIYDVASKNLLYGKMAANFDQELQKKDIEDIVDAIN